MDRSKNIIGGLFYLKEQDDLDEGGNLELYKWKSQNDFIKMLNYDNSISRKQIDLIKTIKYKKNTIVFFLNSLDSLHSVTSRKVNSVRRKYIYLSCDFKNKKVYKKSNLLIRVLKKIINKKIFKWVY